MASGQLTSAAALRTWNDQLQELNSGNLGFIDGQPWPVPVEYGNVSCQPPRRGRSRRVRNTNRGSQGNMPVPFQDPPDTSANLPTDPPGTLLQAKRVDEVYVPEQDTWISRDSVIQEKPKAKDAYESYAFTFTRRFDQMMMSSTTTVDIRSDCLRRVGKDDIGPVSGISWTAKPLKVDPQVLIAFLPALEGHATKLQSIEKPSKDDLLTLEHLEFFISALRNEYSETLAKLSSLLSHEEISFDLIYALFVPGSTLYFPCPVSGTPRAARLSSISLIPACPEPYWQLQVEYVEYDSGSSAVDSRANEATEAQFGFANLTLTIFEFKGAQKITSLPVFPFQYFPTAQELKSRLIERAKKWVSLQGMHHKYYSGIAFHNKNGCYVKINCNSRIMIDWGTFSQTVPNYRLPVVKKTLDGQEINRHAATYSTGAIASSETSRVILPLQWDDKLLQLCSSLVYGFSLMDKLWLEFAVEQVESFEWNDEPFENLVLEPNAKKLVKSLVETHNSGAVGFDDFVKGKGQGLVINLFGNPGVGKTLTAEATSEYVRRPLYVVGAGDLGTSASVLDAHLTRIFSISSTWNAVVLIDEADVFLEQRSLHDLERNAMVAVFLRQLEYFRGILFLTTNRVRTFDEAFQSRIHVSLKYHDLTNEARLRIWAAFIKKAQASVGPEISSLHDVSSKTTLTDDEMVSLSTRKVNGRQIKNVVRTASALAKSSQEALSYSHLVQVLDLMEAFELDLPEKKMSQIG